MNKFFEKIRRSAADVARAFDKQGQVSASQQEAISAAGRNIGESKIAEFCPYCQSKDFVKRGMRKKKLEMVQLYLCRKCQRTFTAQFVKGKHYPTKLIIDAISIYNLGYGLETTCRLVNERYGLLNKISNSQLSISNKLSNSNETMTGKKETGVTASTLNDWYLEYAPLCRYSRLRQFGVKMFKPEETVESITLAHRQLYRYRFHRAKMALSLQEYKHRHLEPLKSYLESVFAETPHQYFQDGFRMSEVKTKFNKAQMIVRAKNNYANRLAEFVLQAVKDNKQRHEELQKFMIANDSVTVATEVPVYIRGEDIGHMENNLGFDVGDISGYENKAGQVLLTGHIDIVQVRNGQIHLLDYKPHAAKEKPIEQLTWYAMALSRLTGLRLLDFKCAWFDEKDYFEFYPLHVVKKITHRIKNKKVFLKARGMTIEIPNEDLGRKVKII